MPLPQATQDISEHPALGSVVEPIDRQKLQTDVDRKLKLYGIVAAMKQFRLPTNDQFDSLLAHLSRSTLAHSSSLSPEGQVLAQDAHDILETLRALVREKNADELLQDFIWHTRDVSFNAAKRDPRSSLPVEEGKDGQLVVRHLRTLLSLVFTNGEVRKLVGDFGVIGRDLLARGAMKVAEAARPNAELLGKVDQPAPDHTFYTEGGPKAGPGETPNPQVSVPGTDVRVAHDPRAEDGPSGTSIQQGGQVGCGDEAATNGQLRASQYKHEAQRETERQVADIQQRAVVDVPVQDEEDAQERKMSLQERFSGMKSSLLGHVPDEHRDRANKHIDRARHFFNDEYFPSERRDQFLFRLKKAIYECQCHDDYRESVTWLLSFLEDYAAHGRTIASQSKESQQKLSTDQSLQQSLSEVRTLLERFANGCSLSTVGDAMRVLHEDALQDARLRTWFQEVDEFIRECLLQPGYVLDDQSAERARELRDAGRQYYDGKYKSHFDHLLDIAQGWFKAWANDPLNRQFGGNVSQLTKNLLFDREGQLKFKPALWADVRQKIIPGFIEQIGYLPIPRIEYTDDQYDIVLENLALSGKNLFPNLIHIDAHNRAKLSAYNNIQDESHHEVTLTLAQIQADMRDVAFYFNKKTGATRLSDSGLADVLIGGQGLTIAIHLVSPCKDRSSVFQVKDVHTTIDTLKLSIRDSKHDALYKVFSPLATGLVKKHLQKAIGSAIRTAFEYIDGQLVSVRDAMAEERASEEKDRDAVLKEQLEQRRREVEKARAQVDKNVGQFQVVTDPSEKLLPEQGYSGGWMNRAEERQQSVQTGEEWRSDTFNVL